MKDAGLRLELEVEINKLRSGTGVELEAHTASRPKISPGFLCLGTRIGTGSAWSYPQSFACSGSF